MSKHSLTPRGSSVRRLNREKKQLRRLRCGVPMNTDRCRRFCPKCHQRNKKTMGRENCHTPVEAVAAGVLERDRGTS